MLDAASALYHLHDELGCPIDHAHAFDEGRAAVRRSLHRPDRPLVAVLCANDTDADQARTWVTGEVEVLEVEEGWLVVGRAQILVVCRPIPCTRLDDLDPTRVSRWLCARPSSGSAPEQALGALGVLVLDEDIWRPTHAAFVIAGRAPHQHVPACSVRARIDDGRVTMHVGAIPELLGAVDPGGVDPWLVREALANALLHRSWSTDEPVKVRITGDRLLIGNPGRLRRTPTFVHGLAVACGLLEPHQGLRQLVDRLRAARLPEHSFVERDDWVWFSARLPAPAPAVRKQAPLPARPAPVRLPAQRPPVEPVPPPAEPLGDRTAEVLDQLRLHGRRTTKEIAAALGCSRPVVGKVLTRLVADGLVRQVAPGRSPFQSYELASRGKPSR